MGFSKALVHAFVAALAAQAAQAKVLIEQTSLAALSTQGWAAVSEPAKSTMLQLQLNLKLQNLDRLVSELYAVSDPENERYGQWYDKQDILNLVNPPPISQTAVLSWLQSQGVTVLGANGQVITIQIPVQNANALLDARFVNYEKNGIRKIRTLSYSVPDEVAEYIDIALHGLGHRISVVLVALLINVNIPYSLHYPGVAGWPTQRSAENTS